MQTKYYQVQGTASLRIALVSDLHNIPCDRLLDDLEQHNPDFIIIAGDIVYGAALDRKGFEYESDTPMLLRFPNADRFIHEAPRNVSTFFSYGNHEWLLNEADKNRIEDTGVVILHNTFTRYKDFIIGGLSSPDVTNYWVFQEEWRIEHPDDNRGNLRRSYYNWKTHEERKTVDVSWLPEFEKQEGYKILICHHPEYWSLKEPRLCEHPIDLVLAGHAHGGQIRIGQQGLYASGQGWFPKCSGGIHHGIFGNMIVSRGLSNTLPIPRLFNPPEMVYIDIRPKQ